MFDTRKAEGQRVDAGAVPAASTRPVKARMRRSLLRGLLSRNTNGGGRYSQRQAYHMTAPKGDATPEPLHGSAGD